MTDPYFWMIAASAVFVVSLAKSGLLSSIGLVGVPMLALVMAPREAAGVMLPILLVMDAFAFYAYRHDVNWPNLKVMLPGAIAGIAIGWVVSPFVSDDMVLLAVGLITVIFILYSVLPIFKTLAGLPPSKPWGVFWGGFAGFTSFVSHAGGPPFQIFVLPQKLTPAVFAGTTAWFFAIVNAIKLIPYFFLGQISVSSLKLSLMLTPVAAVGMIIGIFLVRRISPVLFYRVAYVLVFLLGLKLIYDGVAGIWGGA